MEHNFDDIRPFNDKEMQAEIQILSEDENFLSLLMNLFPQSSHEDILKLLNSFQTVRDFQVYLIDKIVKPLMLHTTTGVVCSGFEEIKNSFNRLFISNHRDIVLDAVYLNFLLLQEGRDTCEIAIGDNLFIYPWIEKVVRINKSIVVKRNITGRAQHAVSCELSAYLRHAITEKNSSVWIAQREGRAKDSNDITQVALLKMLNMSGKSGCFTDNMRQLNITPVTISYEYDPCDYLKAKEFQEKRDNPDYKKKPETDALNMKTGIEGQKGRVQYVISELQGIETIKQGTVNEQLEELALLIDKHIHKNYTIYPGNMIAFDLLEGKNMYTGKYSEEEKTTFEKYLQRQLDKIKLENKDVPFLRKKILEMYANPLTNHLKATKLN